MRMHVLSDLHCEFAPFEWPRTDADVVIIAGDADTGLHGFQQIQRQFEDRPVLYLLGNHEYYGEAIPRLLDKLRELSEGTNIRILECDAQVMPGVRFLGCTLWTDFRLLEPPVLQDVAMWTSAVGMNDYRRIRVSPAFSKLRPRDTLRMHEYSRQWLQATLAQPFDGRTVVITHHAPLARSLPNHRRTDPLSVAYASDLTSLIEGNAIDLWVHGHTHHCVDYMLGRTRIVSNQRGYIDERVPGFRPDLVVEI